MAINLIYSIISWAILTYYITSNGPVVKRGNSYFSICWEDIRSDEYKTYKTISDRIFRTKTFEFTRSYMRSTNKDTWKDKARFWGVKDYDNLEMIINKYFNQNE